MAGWQDITRIRERYPIDTHLELCKLEIETNGGWFARLMPGPRPIAIFIFQEK